MSAIGVVKQSKKALKQRAARFAAAAAEPAPEPPRKVMAHSAGGLVRLSADPVQKLVDLCKRKVAAGEKLTDLQYDALLKYGVDPASIGATRGIVGFSSSSSSGAAGGGSASSAQPPPPSLGSKRSREDSVASAPASGSPLVVLRKTPSGSSAASAASSGLGASSSSGSNPSGRGGGGGAAAGGSAGGAGAVPVVVLRSSPAASLLDSLPRGGRKRIKALNRLLHRLSALGERKARGEVLSKEEQDQLELKGAVAAALETAMERQEAEADGEDSS